MLYKVFTRPPCAGPKRHAICPPQEEEGARIFSVDFEDFFRRESGTVPLNKILDNAKGIAQDP